MESEKVKEIKNNIIICSNKIECKGCSLFPNMKSTNCRNKLLADALTLINELESEKERLRLEIDVLIGKKIVEKQKYDNALIMKIDIQEQLKDRIAELENENVKQLKQFAERLKEKLKEKVNADNVDVFIECAKLSDETLKEFINEE